MWYPKIYEVDIHSENSETPGGEATEKVMLDQHFTPILTTFKSLGLQGTDIRGSLWAIVELG